MTFGFSTPLLDTFRRGEVDREVRLLAAGGVLAPRAPEQLALLVLLVADADPAVAARAEATIALLPRERLARFLATPEAPDDVRRFFARRGIDPLPGGPPPGDEPFVETAAEAAEAAAGAAAEKTAPRLVSALSIMERLKLAMRGTREQRAALIRDPNKLVAAAVLSSPKLTESEVESFARMGNVSEEVLRIIGRTRAWMKNYAIMSALARNSKTPPAISLRLVPQLNARDIKMLSVDRNVPEALRIAARKFLVAAESRKH